MIGLGRVLLVVLAIPVIGFLVGYWIIADIDSDLLAEGLPNSAFICSIEEVQSEPGMRAACDEFRAIQTLKMTSLGAAGVGLGIPMFAFLGAQFAGTNRRRLAVVFRPMVALAVMLLAGLVLVQGGILAYAAYLAESYAIGRVHFFLIGAVAIGALIGAASLIKAAFTMARPVETTVLGKAVSESDSPRLYRLVSNVADVLGSARPNNIVVGLEPNFFATSATTNLIGGPSLKGETLYVSAPLSRVLSEQELTAIIGHELGHFRGDDTQYSKKFAPIYAGLDSALQSLASDGDESGASEAAKIPAMFVLGYVQSVFNTAESDISRQREIAADKAGVEAASAEALGTALCKVGVYSGLWNQTQRDNVDRLAKGRISENLSRLFADSARFDVTEDGIRGVIDEVLKKVIPHPTDSHPPISTRLKEIGQSPEDVVSRGLKLPDKAAAELVDNLEQIEQDLTLLQHKLQVAMGRVVVPKDRPNESFAHGMYLVVASLIQADGRVEADEVQAAEAIGMKLLDEFDRCDFREFCARQISTDEAVSVAGALSSVMDLSERELFKRFLNAVAESDSDDNPNERALLQRFAEAIDSQPLPERAESNS